MKLPLAGRGGTTRKVYIGIDAYTMTKVSFETAI